MAIVKVTDGNVVIIPAVADTAVMEVVPFGTHSIGISQTAGVTGEDISVDTRGVYELPATTAEAFVVGALVKWDTTTGACLALGDVNAGIVIEGKLATVAGTILVKIG
jgi:predicted RecA/RadA family phage recombinase